METFNWAKEKARFYVQTGKTGPVDVWEKGEGTGQVAYIPSYWAGYPGRSAFYSRDFCHQLVGAHLLGLQEENFTMMKAFASSADEGKKWFPLWAINFDGSPYLLDYRGDDDFVREVPATFELVEKAYELYLWTGDDRYIRDEIAWKYYTKAVTDFITIHDTQLPNGVAEGTGKGIFAGAASYNEAHDHPIIESGDGIACQYKAFEAYAKMAALRGEDSLATVFAQKTMELYNYFNQVWGIANTATYLRGYLADGAEVGGWGKENSWFMPMKGITAGGAPRTTAYLDFINDRLESKDDIPPNIEAISYIPETFFLHHQNERGWRWMKHIMENLKQDHSYQSATGRNGDYPEVSYVLIQNMVKDLMGISPNAKENAIRTFSHLPAEVNELEVKNIRIGTSLFSVQHVAQQKTKLVYVEGNGDLSWRACFPGNYDHLMVNGVKQTSLKGVAYGQNYAYLTITMKKGDEVVIHIP
ncbi:MAG: hypothetical protein R2828_34855 [Saprospiraceae bacterium]